jgi:hypothetical protein
VIRRPIALCLAAALVGCADPVPASRLSDARSVTLTLTIREVVSWRGKKPAKVLRFALRGGTREETGQDVLETSIAWAELTYVDAEGRRMELATDGTREEPARDDTIALARRALIEGLVGRPVALRFTPEEGERDGRLESLEGLSEALTVSHERAAGSGAVPPEVLDLAAGGLEPLFDDARVLAALRGAGLGTAGPVERARGVEMQRSVAVPVAGSGWVDVPVWGRSGDGRGGARTVRMQGKVPADAVFSGDAGDAPPPSVGPIRVQDVSVIAETSYHPRRRRAQRGGLTLELPHESGPLVRRAVEFLLVVNE